MKKKQDVKSSSTAKTPRKSEKYYREITNNFSDIIIVTDRTGDITYCSRSIEHFTGYKPEHLVGQSAFNYIHPEELENAIGDFKNAVSLNENILIHNGFRVVHKNGSAVYLDGLAKNFLNNPEVSAFVLNVRDITERRIAEEKLKKSEARYRLIAEHMKDFIWVYDMNLKPMYISPSVEKATGYTSAEFKKLTLDKILTRESFHKAMQMYLEEMSGAGLMTPSPDYKRSIEGQVRCKDGRLFWVESTLSFLYDENGKPVSILGEGRDITERRIAEEKLREQEERFRTLAEQSYDIIVLVKPDGKIFYENSAIERILGYNLANRIGRDVFENIHPDDVKGVIAAYKTLVSDINSPVQKNETRIRHADGSWRTFEVAGSNLVQNNILDSIILNLRDITERKHVEEKLQKTLENLRKSFGITIQVLTMAIEMRDPYTAGHQTRSSDIARAIAVEMGLPCETIEGIRMACSIHDIGKLSVPSEILTKPSKLMDIEFSLIKEHSRNGYEMIKDFQSPWPLAEIIHQHHERMDGSGYPRNLKGNEILMEARILAVADIVEAMASHRPYRPSMGIESALSEIENNRGTLYDDDVVGACLDLFREKGYKLKQ